MNNKPLVFIFALFIIYFLCKKNKIKGGQRVPMEEDIMMLQNNWNAIDNDEKDLRMTIFIEKFGKAEWRAQKRHIKNIELKYKLSKNEFFKKLDNFSIKELSSVIDKKKIKNKLNNSPQVDYTKTNYELFISEQNNPNIEYEIINGTYWVHKIDNFSTKYANKQDSWNNNKKMKATPLINQRELYLKIVKKTNEKINKINNIKKIKNNLNQENDEMEINSNNFINNSNIVCPTKNQNESCVGIESCWTTNFCECPEAQYFCKKNMAKKFMNENNINENEQVDRIINIFHGNSMKESNEDILEDTIEELEPVSQMATTLESPPPAPPVQMISTQTVSTDAPPPPKPPVQMVSTRAPPFLESPPSDPVAQMVSADQMIGGMNELDIDDNMEILNKFHGGSANYEKF